VNRGFWSPYYMNPTSYLAGLLIGQFAGPGTPGAWGRGGPGLPPWVRTGDTRKNRPYSTCRRSSGPSSAAA